MKSICHFVSTIEYDLLINGEYIARGKEDSIDVVITSAEVSVMCVPLATGYGIVSAKVQNIKNSILVNSNDISVVPMGRGHWQIEINFRKTYVDADCDIIATSISGKNNICIYNNPMGVIDISTGSLLRLRKNCDKIVAAEIDIVSGCNVIKCQLIDNKYYIIVIDDKCKILFDTICNSYETNENKCKTIAEVCDIAGHGVVKTFDMTDKTIDCYAVYTGEVRYASSDRLVPMAMLQSLMVGDNKLAKSYLCAEMQSISDDKLQQYFGKFDRVVYNRYIADGTINYTVCGEDYRNYDFVIKNGRIDDIVEVVG